MQYRYHVLSKSDANVLLPLLIERINTVEEHCKAQGFDPYEVPYFTHLRALEEDLSSFVDQ